MNIVSSDGICSAASPTCLHSRGDLTIYRPAAAAACCGKLVAPRIARSCPDNDFAMCGLKPGFIQGLHMALADSTCFLNLNGGAMLDPEVSRMWRRRACWQFSFPKPAFAALRGFRLLTDEMNTPPIGNPIVVFRGDLMKFVCIRR